MKTIEIELDQVEKVYSPEGRQTTVALEKTSLSIFEHEFVAIVGPSGCGKSTLLNLIAGLLTPSSGSVEVFGRPVHGPVTDIGYVFQRDLLLPWRSVRKNVLLQAEVKGLPATEALGEAERLLDMVGLAGFEDRLPHELSGGMRQRAAICRALLHKPALLLMDEPFGALDALTRDQMNLDLLRLQEQLKNTVVFITHSIEEAVFLGDRVLVMSPRPGRVVDEISIELPKPRNPEVKDHPLFGEYVARIRNGFEDLGIIR